MKTRVAEEFDISKYVTAADVASAVTAGIIAYIRNRPKTDDQQQQPQAGSSEQPSDGGNGAAAQADAVAQALSLIHI